MKSLQLLDLFFILLSLHSSVPFTSSDFAEFKCDDRTVKLGENASIPCKSTKEITRVKVTFCSHDDSCPDTGSIDTEAGMYAADNGRISLKNISSFLYYLNIHNVKISDHRQYKFSILSNYGYIQAEGAHLKVNAPYTINEVIQQNSTTIVCNASGGFPKSQLYWFDKNGTNLTDSSKTEATEDKDDGSFFLSSTLQVESPIGEIYCCSFNNTTCSKTNSHWTTSQHHTSSKRKSEGSTVSALIPVALAFPLAIVAVLCFIRKKGANDVNFLREFICKVLPNQREQTQPEANYHSMPVDQISVTSIHG